MKLPVERQESPARICDAAARAAYLHVPFCRHRCGYCSFTLVAGRDDLIVAYLAAIERELSGLGRPRHVDTLFVGGGTPTHLSPSQLRRLFHSVLQWFAPSGRFEFTVEANPADLDAARVDVFREFGVNRVSLGAQSFDPAKLQFLDRDHDAAQIARAVDLARSIPASVSLDLIFATPGESPACWRRDVESAVALAPDHVSTYGLTIERGTRLWSRWSKGQVARPPEERERGMFEFAIDRLEAAGFEHYEVSNFARPGRRCRHNEAYWAGDEFYAAGPGAARYVAGRREVNHRSTTTYLKRVLAGESPVAESEELAPDDRAAELFVFGMRRTAGVRRDDFERRTGRRLDALFAEPLERFIRRGWLEDTGDSIRLTREGLFVSDSMWPYFLDV